MDALFLVGRFLFGLLFIVSGLAGHLAGYRQLTGYAAAKKIPFAGRAVLVSGARGPGPRSAGSSCFSICYRREVAARCSREKVVLKGGLAHRHGP